MLIALLFATLLILGVPIAMVLGVTSLIVTAIAGDIPLVALPQYMFVGLDSFPLMAIPFFVLAGEVMGETGLSKRLIGFAQELVGRIRGGLAQVNIVTSIFFGGITGAAVADTAAVGSILIPSMKEEGYGADYAAAITASSSAIGPIIPPSIILVVYGISARTSIAQLLIAGIVPGVLMGISLSILAFWQANRRGYPRIDQPFKLTGLIRAFWTAIPALVLPIIIVGGIVGGVFTPTEAASVAVAYAMVLGLLTGTLRVTRIPQVFLRASITTGVVMLLIAVSNFFSMTLIIHDIPRMVAEFFLGISQQRVVMLLMINVLLLLTGMFMEISAATIILVPLLLPMVTELGVSPVHFGIIMSVNLAIGLATPPVGPTLFVASRISGVGIEGITRAIWPFIVALIVALLIITFCEGLVLLLPRLLL